MLLFLFVLSVQSTWGATFGSILEGKQSQFENKVNVDDGLLNRLEEHGIITNIQRTAIEVTSVSVCIFIKQKLKFNLT